MMDNFSESKFKNKKVMHNTVSLCPESCQETPAYITDSRYGIGMVKRKCDSDNSFVVLDKDKYFYKLSHSQVYEDSGFKKIVLDITTRCNLNCPVCYRDKKKMFSEPSLSEMEKLSYKFSGKLFLLSGGEPTMREDLPQIIEIFNKKTKVILLTNGIKLADLNYIDILKRSGLGYVSLAFNGFDDSAYEIINGTKMIDKKITVLNNLKKENINTLLSFLLIRGVNEKQIRESLNYYIKERGFVRELRIRSMAYIGRFINEKRYSLSEMVGLLSDLIEIPREILLREVYFIQAVNNFFRRRLFVVGSCSIDFHFKLDGSKIIAFGEFIDTKKLKGKKAVLYIAKKLMELYGIDSLFTAARKMYSYSSDPCFYGKKVIKIGLRSWPDKYTVDFCERCQTAAFDDKGILIPFCHANIKKECR